MFRLGSGLRPVLPGIAVLAAIPLTLYALNTSELQRTGSSADEHVEFHHWSHMEALAFAIYLVGLVACTRTPGWRIRAWSAAAAAVVFGLASVLFPNYAGAAGRTRGTVAVGGGVLFLAAAEWDARRSVTT